jgi:D-alanyl-D-alanine carboxypeptidase/D-alanyl-D-alanine-endopeptidase (penicillin-binding protein 4)
MNDLALVRLLSVLSAAFLLASPSSADLSRDLSRILSAPELAGGIDGVMAADVGSGRILYARNLDILMMPASNRKLFTAAAALALLGPDKREETDVLAAAKPDSDGTITGDLVLRGGGDPLVSVDDLDLLAKSLAGQGVKHVTGGVVADSSYFTGWPWGDGWQVDSLLAYYAPEISALEVDEGIATIALHGGAKLGDPTTFEAAPQTGYFSVDDRAVTGATGSTTEIDIDRPISGNDIVITGSIPVGASPDPTDDNTDGRITIHDPALYAATVFAEHCKEHGIAIDGLTRDGVAPSGAALLAVNESVEMRSMLAKMLKPSDNLIAECLTRLESAVSGGPGTYADGSRIEDKYFATIGIGPRDHLFADGSGVSRCDFVKPSALMKLLLALAKQPDFSIVYNAMSIVGVDGTAAGRMIGTPVAGNAHVKTGTIRNCRSFSGYVTDRSGHMLAFVILMNNHLATARQLGLIQDKIVERLQQE